MGTAAGIYVRISSDDEGTGLGVQRQEVDCRAEAERRGWGVAAVYSDNDVSATRAKVRPQYERMLADVALGRITALVVWDVDRLSRSPRELEDVIDLADHHGLALASVGGEIDLSTPQGRLTARLKGSVARHETEQQSRRLRRKLQEKAERGARHGFAPYGWEAKTHGPDQVNDEQARVIQQAARALLAGQSLRSVVAALNDQGIRPPRGDRWSSAQLRQVLVRERNCGRRVHQGRVIGLGDWPAILDEDTHDRVVAMLTDPERRTNRGATRRHLLSGIARCGRPDCDGTMIVNVGRMTRGKTQPPAYVCKTCTRVRRRQQSVDDLVERLVVARLQRDDALSVLAAGDADAVNAARAEVAGLKARLDRAADDYADDLITADQLRRITAKVRPQVEEAQARVRGALPHDGLADLVGDAAGARWAVAPLDVRRAVVELLMTVTIMPTGAGGRFNPDSVRVEWV